MAAYLQEAAVIKPLLAGEHRLDRRLHVVVDPTCAGALEEGEGAIIRLKDQLLALGPVDIYRSAMIVAAMFHVAR